MSRYLGKRSFSALLTVVVSIFLNFMLVRIAPGNPATILAGVDNPNPDQIVALTEKFGLNKSYLEQFGIYVQNVLKGDFGYSFQYNRPVLDMIIEKIIPTIVLSLTSLVLAVVLGTLLGIYAARRNGSAFDNFMSSLSYVFDSTPSFWLSLIMILTFASSLRWFPTSGMVNLRAGYKGWQRTLDIAYHLVLPVTTLVIVQFPYYFRIARSSVIQVMNEDFITTLRATGMSERRIFNKYVLRNALIPTVTILGSSIAFLLSGTLYIETVFAWPGMGRLLFDSIGKRDYPVLSGIYLMIAISVAVMMIAVDILYGLVDPRIKYE